MDDFDIYDDLELLHAQEQQKAAEDLQWKEKYEVALGTIEKLQIEKKELNKKIKQLEVNFASLLDTARTEIKRKDNLITELRREKDDICFRRNERPMRKDPVKNNAGNQARRDEHFNTFALDTPIVAAKVVDKPVGERPVASGSKQRNETEKPGNRDKYREPPQSERERDQSRYRNRDEFGRRDERDFNRRYDRDLSQTGSSDSNRDRPNKGKNTHSHHKSNRKENPSNTILHKSPSSKLENNPKERREASKELKKDVANESKTENCVSTDGQKKKTTAIEHKEKQNNPTLEKEILKDVKEFKKLKLAEDKNPKPVEDPMIVATEKSNQFIDALFDDMMMNVEEMTNDLEEVAPSDKCNNVKCVPEKRTEEIVSKTDENCNVELQLQTPLKHSVNKLFEDLFGESPAVTVSAVRRNSISSVGESSSDAVEIKQKPDDFIPISTPKTLIVTDLSVEDSSSKSKSSEGNQTTDKVKVASMDSKTSPHAKKVKSFKFAELDSSFYSSEDEDVNRKENSIQSQSDIESPPFENCGVTAAVGVKSVESNCIGQRVEKGSKSVSENIRNQTSISSKCDKTMSVERSKSKDGITSTEICKAGDIKRDQKSSHPEKQKESQHSHHTSEKNEKKDDSTRKDSHRHHYSSNKSTSSSRSNNSQKSDESRLDSESHHHRLGKESKQEHRSSNKCSESSRRHSKDSRYHSSHESKSKNNSEKRMEKEKNGVNPIQVKEVISLEKCSPRSGWFKSNETNTISLVKAPPLEKDNSSDLKLYQDQIMSLNCDDILSDEENEISIRTESSAESKQNPNDEGLDEISDDENVEVETGVSAINGQHINHANEDQKHNKTNGEKHENESRSNVKATGKLEIEDKIAQEQNNLENMEHKSPSSSRSNNSHRSDKSKLESEMHHHRIRKESKQEHHASDSSTNSSSRKCSESSRRHSKDSRYHSSHEGKNKNSIEKRMEKKKNGVDRIEIQEVILLERCSPMSGWFKSNESNTMAPPLQEDNSSDLKLYQDQIMSLNCDDILSDEENEISIRTESSAESKQNPNDVGLDEISNDKNVGVLTGVSATNAQHENHANEDLDEKSDKQEIPAENKERNSNDHIVESSKLIDEKEKDFEITNCEVESGKCIPTSTIGESIAPTKEDEFIRLLSDTKESSETRNSKEIVANTGIEADSVESRRKNFMPNDEIERILDSIHPSETVMTTIGKNNNVEVEAVVGESARARIEEQTQSLADVSSTVPEHRIDTNDKLSEKSEKCDEVPPILDVEDVSKRKNYDKTENAEVFLMDLVSTIPEVDKRVESNVKNVCEVLESNKSPKLTDTSMSVVERRINEKVEPPQLCVPLCKSAHDEQVESSNVMNEKAKCSARENKTKHGSACKYLIPYVEKKQINSSIATGIVSTGRRTKLKTPRKCTDDGTNPFTIMTIVSSRYAKSEDGRSTNSNKSPQVSSPHLRRTQSSSYLGPVDEKSTKAQEGKSESVVPQAREVSDGSSYISLPEDQQIAKPMTNISELDSEKDKAEMVQKTTVKHLKMNVKKMFATSSDDSTNHLKEDRPEQGFITESVATTISKKRKRDKLSADSVHDADKGAVITTSDSTIPHKKRILQNSTTSGESSYAVPCVTKSPVTEKSCVKDKQTKKKFAQGSKGSLPTITGSSDTNSINLSTTGIKKRRMSYFETPDFTEFVSSKVKHSEVQHPEESTATSGKSLKNSLIKTFVVTESIGTTDNKGKHNKNVETSFSAVESIATSKETFVTSVNKKTPNKNIDNTGIDTVPTTTVTSDSKQASGIDVESIVTSEKSFPNSPTPVVEQLETPVVISPSIEITEFLVLHSVKSTQTNDNKRKYKKQIMQNFIDSNPNASGDHKNAKILQNSSGSCDDEPLVMASDSKNIHHKKRFLQQSIVTECPAIEEIRNPNVKNKKRQTKKVVQNSTNTKKQYTEKNPQCFTDIIAETVTPSRTKKKRNHNSQNFDVEEAVSDKGLSNVEEDYEFFKPVKTSGSRKKRNSGGVQNSSDSDVKETSEDNKKTRHDETIQKCPDFDTNASAMLSFAKVPATSHNSKKYKKRILQCFTGSNSIESEASNVQNLQHSTELQNVTVDNKDNKQKSSDSNTEHSASVITGTQDPPICHNKKNDKNFVENSIDFDPDSVLRDYPEICQKKSLVVSVTKLKLPKKTNSTLVIEKITHQENKLQGSTSSIDPSLCVRTSFLTCSSETDQSCIESSESQSTIPQEVEISQGNTSSIHIKRKMKPNKEAREKKKKQKLASSIPSNDCDKPSSPISASEKKDPIIAKRKRSPSHDKSLAVTPTHHEIFNSDVFPENQQAALLAEYDDNDDNVQYQEIDDRMRSMFQSPTYSHTNGGCSFELVNGSLQDDNLKDNLTVEETLNQSEKSLGDISTSSRKISVGSNDYVIETVGALTANVFITRKRCKKRSKMGIK